MRVWRGRHEVLVSLNGGMYLGLVELNKDWAIKKYKINDRRYLIFTSFVDI